MGEKEQLRIRQKDRQTGRKRQSDREGQLEIDRYKELERGRDGDNQNESSTYNLEKNKQ